MQHDDSTRTFDTVQGTKNYAELNDLIAQPYRMVLDAVLGGQYDEAPVDSDLLRDFHREFVGGVMPGIAGQWRMESVQVGSHTPPPHWDVEYMMRDAMDNLVGRMEYTRDDPVLQIEALAYAECAFLHVHPFKDFNGRAVRLFCWFLGTRKFGLPISRTWVEAGTPAATEYINALCEFDLAKNCIPMRDFWFGNRIDTTLAP